MSVDAARLVPDEQTRLLRLLLLVSRRRRAPGAVFGADRAQRAAHARDAARPATSSAPARHQHAPQRVSSPGRQQRHHADAGRRRRRLPAGRVPASRPVHPAHRQAHVPTAGARQQRREDCVSGRQHVHRAQLSHQLLRLLRHESQVPTNVRRAVLSDDDDYRSTDQSTDAGTDVGRSAGCCHRGV